MLPNITNILDVNQIDLESQCDLKQDASKSQNLSTIKKVIISQFTAQKKLLIAILYVVILILVFIGGLDAIWDIQNKMSKEN